MLKGRERENKPPLFKHENFYPALFRSADEAANSKQRIFLTLIRTEYGLLLLASVFSLHSLAGPTFHLMYALVFVCGIIILLTRALWKPEQDWYRCRALAESIKTLTWRYVMHASPFQASENGPQVARAEFRNQLQAIFDENRSIAATIHSDWSAEDQITNEMDRIRALDRADRASIYVSDRVDEQRRWYAAKAAQNKRSAKIWVATGVAAYAIAAILVLGRVRFTAIDPWPIEPIIVLASLIIGWMQIKKFNELGAAYTVAAHEIGLIKPRLDEVADESSFSEFVNDAELAFSREHTLWIARQSD